MKDFITNTIRKSFVWSYRISAIFVLYGLLAVFFGYTFLLGFYALNSSWVAPIVISPSDQQSLDLTVKMVQTQTAAEALKLDVAKLKESMPEFRHHRATLLALEPEVSAAIQRETNYNLSSGQQLESLSTQKTIDNYKSAKVMKQVRLVEDQINSDLAAGLITKGDAAVQISELNTAESAFTDSKIAEVVVQDSILQKRTINTTLLDTLDKQAELISEASELTITITSTERQIAAETRQINSMDVALQTAEQTPNYAAITKGQDLDFAFVPYGNAAAARLNSKVYDCLLSVIVCRQVGVVSKIFDEEEHAIHPIFKTDMRGYLIELKLNNTSSAKSETLLLNRKPLLF